MLKSLLDADEPTTKLHMSFLRWEEDFSLLAIASVLVADHRSRAVLHFDDPKGFVERNDDALREVIELYGLNSYQLAADRGDDSDGGVRLLLDGQLVPVDEAHLDVGRATSWSAIAASPLMARLRPHLSGCALSYADRLTEWANSISVKK